MSAKRGLIASLVLLVLGATVQAGGWAVLTLRDLPEHAIAGAPLTLTFMLRRHGMTPLDGMTPVLTAKSGSSTVRATAVPTKTSGEYTAAVVFPRPGKWTFDVGPFSTTTLPALTVIAPGKPLPPLLSPAARGERLFVAKGCYGCHANREVGTEESGGFGPDLTGRRFPETYLTRLLADPQSTFARDSRQEEWEMPNLALKESEIAALVAFLNRERTHARR
jgi:mono/diheme cytochrome c family protein